jgi:4-methylaminobutanoate oxidase (formaldehyde-forming)
MGKGDFTGRAALAAEGAPKRRLVTLAVDGFAPFLSGETVLHDGRPVASLTSAGYGHHLGKTIGFAYVPVGIAGGQGFTIEAFGKPYAATRGPRCLYDAKMERLKA